MKYAITMIPILLPYKIHAIEQFEVNHVLGLSAVGVSSCIAVWVPLDINEAINGVLWYNNDGTIVFPSIQVGCGLENQPGLLGDMICVAQNVQGGSVQWSMQVFDESIASTAGGLYVVLKLPAGSEQVDVGSGGGAGVGYSDIQGGLNSWLSWDGQYWMAIHNSIRVAIEPIIVEANSGTIIMNREDKGLNLQEDIPQIIATTALNPPSPNPFNPKTIISFTLANAGDIELTVHNLRGAIVRRMANGMFSAGLHEISWLGRDDDNRRVGSGVYIVRLKTIEGVLARQVVLLK